MRERERRDMIRTQQFEVVLRTIEHVKAYVRLDRDALARITQVRIATGHDGEALALGLPGKVSYRV